MQNNEIKEVENAKHKIQQNIIECKKRGILICTLDPKTFIGAFFAGINSEVPVFLANPNWRENEWEQVFTHISPALVFGNASTFPLTHGPATQDLKSFSKHIMIPTGGTGGKIQFAMHTWDSLVHSATATALFLKKQIIKSLCLLPLYHISGLIQIVRSIATNGEVYFDPLESFDKNHSFNGFCLSLVPTQLDRFLQNPHTANLLRTFDVVFLGGAPASSALLIKAREANIRLSPTYGMTETGAMVTAMHPEDFLKGQTGVGKALPHSKISLSKDGLINIRANSLFSGYFPSPPIKKTLWATNDEGFIDEDGYLTIIGRADRIIITGGEKVDPKEVENAILATGLVSSVYVAPVQDKEWGQRVIAMHVPLIKGEDLSSQIKEQIKSSLANYKIPKDWIMVNQLPFDEKGKINPAAFNSLLTSL